MVYKIIGVRLHLEIYIHYTSQDDNKRANHFLQSIHGTLDVLSLRGYMYASIPTVNDDRGPVVLIYRTRIRDTIVELCRKYEKHL
jgi:hypothetical protein